MIAYVYDGSLPSLELVGLFEIPDTPLERSIGEVTYSQITLNGENAYRLKNLDLVKIYTKFGEVWGFLLDIVHKKHYQETCTASLAIGTDGLINEESGVEIYTIDEHYENFSQLLSGIVGDETNSIGKPFYVLSYPLTENNTMPSFPTIKIESVFVINVMCLDAMAQAAKFKLEVVGNRLQIAYYQDYAVRGITYQINLDDTIDYTINLSKDSFTTVKAAGKEEEIRSIFYERASILKNGQIVNRPDKNQIYRPEIIKVITAEKEPDETHDNFLKRLQKEAKQELTNYAYNNSIEMIIDIDNYLYKGILFSDKVDPFYYLGNSGELILPDGTKLFTTISAISLQDNIAKITFGMSQKRTFQKIKRRKRV